MTGLPVPSRGALASLVLLLFCFGVEPGSGSSHDPIAPSAGVGVSERIAGMESQDGYVPVHYEASTGKLFLEVTRLGDDFIYANGLAQGVGGLRPRLDRGMLEYTGRQALGRFERRGPNVLFVVENLNFRAPGGTEGELRAVAESFPSAVYAAFPIEAEEPGRLLVDATHFILSDVFDVAGRLRGSGQGEPRLDGARSHVSMEYTRAFPRNTEIRSVVTYVTESPGAELTRHAPDAPLGGRVITLQQHHSFVALPPDGYRSRRFDPRVGVRHTTFRDFSQSFREDYLDRHVTRWRLEKRDPEAAVSEPVQPIIFHMDPAIPEPYRTAYIEGTLWWNQHLEAAGFRNAIQVRDLPEGADPMDVRFSTILLVHRTVAGASTAPHIFDPRTGEILHAIVRMDSHRSLVDYNFYMGLVPALRATGSQVESTAEEMIVLRRKQHVAHEVGHALGFEHNYIAAALGRASVMDYPPPLVELDGRGGLDISRMYRDGGGAHDTFVARYVYTPFDSPAAEEAGLGTITREALDAGVLSLAGPDVALQAAHPRVTRWVEGATMMEALDRTLAVRRILMEHFNEEAILPGEPMALLTDRLTHVYLHHIYSLEGAIKYVGGMEYTYALRGDGQQPVSMIPGTQQRRALALILSALRPEELTVPERVVRMIPPTPAGYDPEERWLQSPTGQPFDPLALARVLAARVVDGLLHRERASRVLSFHARDPSVPSLDEVVGALMNATWASPRRGDSREAAVLRITERAVVDGLITLAAERRAPAEVRAVAHERLARLAEELGAPEPGPSSASDAGPSPEGGDRAHRHLARSDILRFLDTGVVPLLRSGITPVDLPWL